ncbi:MAG: hypothetical protein II825_09420 [Paludibacteraceae bacterium]|nr:hypothetical protein [Paludibacteraceae bacterium]
MEKTEFTKGGMSMETKSIPYFEVNSMDILDLSLTYHWYDEIAAGRKLEEYREITDFYRSRLTFSQWRGTDIFRHYDAVRFHRGQGSPVTMLVECIGIRIGYGREDWGAPKGKQVFVIQLGDILEKKEA